LCSILVKLYFCTTGGGRRGVKRDLDYSRFSEIIRCLLSHIVHQNLEFSVTETSALTPLNECLYLLPVCCVGKAYPRAERIYKLSDDGSSINNVSPFLFISRRDDFILLHVFHLLLVTKCHFIGLSDCFGDGK